MSLLLLVIKSLFLQRRVRCSTECWKIWCTVRWDSGWRTTRWASGWRRYIWWGLHKAGFLERTSAAWMKGTCVASSLHVSFLPGEVSLPLLHRLFHEFLQPRETYAFSFPFFPHIDSQETFPVQSELMPCLLQLPPLAHFLCASVSNGKINSTWWCIHIPPFSPTFLVNFWDVSRLLLLSADNSSLVLLLLPLILLPPLPLLLLDLSAILFSLLFWCSPVVSLASTNGIDNNF